MRLCRLFPLLSILLIASLAPLATAQPAPAPAPAQVGTTRVAVANPSFIFNKMEETKALRAQLEAKGKQLMAQEKQMRDDITTLITSRSQFLNKSEKYKQMSNQIDKAKAELQTWGLVTKASLERDQKEMLMSLYEKIEAATSEVAQKNGIGVVIVDGRQDVPNLEDAPAAEVSRVLNARNILFAAKGVDISEQVITLLDFKYAQAGGQPPPIR